jgi:glycogen debranching enzyme
MPLGLRSLAADETSYVARFQVGGHERDGAYHQGIVWPWLIGPFVEAWLRVNGDNAPTRRSGHARFVAPLLEHLQHAGLGHVSEITDAEAPHTPPGCPFQAWSLRNCCVSTVSCWLNMKQNFSHRLASSYI